MGWRARAKNNSASDTDERGTVVQQLLPAQASSLRPFPYHSLRAVQPAIVCLYDLTTVLPWACCSGECMRASRGWFPAQ